MRGKKIEPAIPETIIGYAAAKVEDQLQSIAASIQADAEEFAARVLDLLRSPRQGAAPHLSNLFRHAAGSPEVDVSEMEMAGGPRGHQAPKAPRRKWRLSAAARKRIADAQRARWALKKGKKTRTSKTARANSYWDSMSAEQRKKEMHRRAQVREDKKAAKLANATEPVAIRRKAS